MRECAISVKSTLAADSGQEQAYCCKIFVTAETPDEVFRIATLITNLIQGNKLSLVDREFLISETSGGDDRTRALAHAPT